MKHWRLLVVVTLLAGLVVALQYRFRAQSANEVTALSPELNKELEGIIIPHFEQSDATAAETIAWLNAFLQQQPKSPSFRFAKWIGPTKPPSFHLEETLQLEDGRLTMSISNLSLAETLRYVCNLLNYSVGQQGNTIYFVEGAGVFGPLIEKTYELPPWTSSRPLTVDDIKAQLDYDHVGFIRYYEGGFVKVSGKTVTICTSEESLLWCDQKLDSKRSLLETLIAPIYAGARWVRHPVFPW